MSEEIEQANRTEEDEVSELETILKRNEVLTQKLHRQWYYYILMRRGAQWVQMRERDFVIPSMNDDEDDRVTINRIAQSHQTKLAKMLKNDPNLEVVAERGSEKAKKKARKGTKLFDYVWAAQNVRKKLKTTCSWELDVGTAFLYCYWDSNLGEEMVAYQRHEGPVTGMEPYKIDNQSFIIDKNGERIEAARAKLGDVRIEFASPFDVHPYGIKNDGSCRGVIFTTAQDVDEMKARFPQIAEFIHPEKEASNRVDYQKKLLGVITNDTYYAQEVKDDGNQVVVKQLFELPSAKYKNGRHKIVISGRLAHIGPLPYAHERIPFIKFIDTEVSGQYWGLGEVENQIPAQKVFNRIITKIAKNIALHGGIKWKVTEDAELEADSLDDSEDEVIIYKRGEQVDQVSPPSLPNYMLQVVESMLPKMMEDISGQHEVTNAQAPGGIKSGVAIEALQSQDDTRHLPTQVDFTMSLVELGEQIVELYEEHVTEPRRLMVKGEAIEFEITPEDLKGMAKLVRIRASTGLNADMRMKKDQLYQLWKDGLFGDPVDPKVRRKVMEMYEFGNIESLFEDENLDAEWAQEENDFLVEGSKDFVPVPDSSKEPLLDASGSPVTILTMPVKEWEDHKVHIYHHDNFRKTKEYRMLPPEIQKRVDVHVDWHWKELNPPKESAPPPPAGQTAMANTGGNNGPMVGPAQNSESVSPETLQ